MSGGGFERCERESGHRRWGDVCREQRFPPGMLIVSDAPALRRAAVPPLVAFLGPESAAPAEINGAMKSDGVFLLPRHGNAKPSGFQQRFS